MQAGTRFALLMQQGKMDKPAAPPMADNDRFHHWAVDRRAACATGVIAIDDEGQGVVISPPSPAAPFRYRRSGERRLPAALAPVARTSAVTGKRGEAREDHGGRR